MIIPDTDRPMHIYVPGKTRHGKSTLLFWMALQDIAQNKGVCVMDAKGDLVNHLLRYIPKRRADDTIYLDINTPVPLDFMSYENDGEKRMLISELKYLLLKTVEPQHAPLMNANLTDLIHTLLNYNENPNTPDHCRATFLDLFYFLDNPERRDVILSRLTDHDLYRRWKNDFPNPTERSRITTRMTPFVRSQTLTAIFGAKKPKLNIPECMDSQKVLLVNLGPIDEIQRMYGTLLLSQIRQGAYRRANPQYPRVPFHLYADEFQEFQTSDFDQMLSMAGGLGLYLTLANQYAEQLDSRILASIKGNVSTFIMFRIAKDTAQQFVHEIPSPKSEWLWKRSSTTGLMDCTERPISFDPADLARLPVGHALYRAADGTAAFVHTLPPPEPMEEDYAQYIRNRTKDIYSCDTPQVCSTEKHEHHASPAGKADEIHPSGTPHVSSHQGKKKNT